MIYAEPPSHGARCRIAQCPKLPRLPDTPWPRCSRYSTHTTWAGVLNLRSRGERSGGQSTDGGRNEGLGCGSAPGEGVLGRQGFCVRECFTPPGNELAATVTRSHPAIS